MLWQPMDLCQRISDLMVIYRWECVYVGAILSELDALQDNTLS